MNTRLAETLAAVAALGDLALGRPAEDSTRASLLAAELARRADLPTPVVADAYYATLLRFAGCAATSHEYAALVGGDDIALRGGGELTDTTTLRGAIGLLSGSMAGLPRARRALTLAGAVVRAQTVVSEAMRADCEVAAVMARRFGLPEAVAVALEHHFERWDGQGAPRGVRGDAIPIAARVAAVASMAVALLSAQGRERVPEAIDAWSGQALDPALCAVFREEQTELLDLAATMDPWLAAIEAEPVPQRLVDEAAIDTVCRMVGDAADLKSPWFQGHAAAVTELAERAAAMAGLEGGSALRRAAALHDAGRVAVPAGVWERPGPLGHGDWEAVRLHAYHGERVALRSPALAPSARLIGTHQERRDGSGYHRGLRAAQMEPAEALLAAADVYVALCAARPHRPALTAAAAASVLASMPLERDAVAAVIEAAGHSAPKRGTWPFGLTDREVEVLRLLAAGSTKRGVASALTISTSTVHTHTVSIYRKTGVSTRGALAMVGIEHGLVRPGG